MRTISLTRSVLACGLLALSACGTSQEDACNSWAQATCDAVQRCDPDALARAYGDAATCLWRQKLTCAYMYPSNSSATADSVTSCAQALPTATCSQIVANQTPTLNNVPACQTQAGTQYNGTLCSNDSQCQSTFCDKGTLGGLCGTCGQRTQLNGDCNVTACAFGLICVRQNGGPSRCMTPGTVGTGQDCDQDAQCTTGQACVGGRCTAVLAANAICEQGGDKDACDRAFGLYCDQSNHCVATQYVAPGGSCAFKPQRTACTGSTQCQNSTDTCVGAYDGQRSVYPCMPPAVPVNGVCTLPDPELCQ